MQELIHGAMVNTSGYPPTHFSFLLFDQQIPRFTQFVDWNKKIPVLVHCLYQKELSLVASQLYNGFAQGLSLSGDNKGSKIMYITKG